MNLRWFTYTHVMMILLIHLKLLDGLNCKSKDENNGRRRSWVTFLNSSHFEGRRAHSLVRNTLGVEGHAGTSRWRLKRLTRKSITHMDLHKPNNKLVNVNLKHFGARTSHKQTQTYKIHHGPDLGEATTFPLIVFFVPGHRASTQMSFCPRTPKWES
jgi:hypothetical protein